MTLAEARRLVWSLERPLHHHDDYSMFRNYEGASDDLKARVIEAEWVLLTEGEEFERATAITFFRTTHSRGLGVVGHRLISAYLAGGWDASHAFADLMANIPVESVTEADLAAVRDTYLKDPARQYKLVRLLLRHGNAVRSSTDDAVWGSFAAWVSQLKDPKLLREAEELAWIRRREFLALLESGRSRLARAGLWLRRRAWLRRFLGPASEPGAPSSRPITPRITAAAAVEALLTRRVVLGDPETGPSATQRLLVFPPPRPPRLPSGAARAPFVLGHFDLAQLRVHWQTWISPEDLPKWVEGHWGRETTSPVLPLRAVPRRLFKAVAARARQEDRIIAALSDGNKWLSLAPLARFLRRGVFTEWQTVTTNPLRVDACAGFAAFAARALYHDPDRLPEEIPAALKKAVAEIEGSALEARKRMRAGDLGLPYINHSLLVSVSGKWHAVDFFGDLPGGWKVWDDLKVDGEILDAVSRGSFESRAIPLTPARVLGLRAFVAQEPSAVLELLTLGRIELGLEATGDHRIARRGEAFIETGGSGEEGESHCSPEQVALRVREQKYSRLIRVSGTR